MISGCTCRCYSVVFFEEKSPSSFISAPLHIIRWCTALASVQQMPLNRSLKQALLKWQPVAWLCGSLPAACPSSLSVKNHNTNSNCHRSYLWQPWTAILLHPVTTREREGVILGVVRNPAHAELGSSSEELYPEQSCWETPTFDNSISDFQYSAGSLLRDLALCVTQWVRKWRLSVAPACKLERLPDTKIAERLSRCDRNVCVLPWLPILAISLLLVSAVEGSEAWANPKIQEKDVESTSMGRAN